MEPPANHHKLLITVLILAVIVGIVFYVSVKTDKSYVIHIDPSQIERNRNLPTPPSTNPAPFVDPATVDVSSCIINPSTPTVALNGTLHFVNTDNVVHVISFSPKISYVIPSQGKKNIIFNFDTTPGTRKFACDGRLGAGTIIITKAD